MNARNIIIFFTAALLSACSNTDIDRRLEQALELSGDNRVEMEKVLTHYEGDSIKLAAAKFLIVNMPGHYSYADTNTILKYSHAVDSILVAMKDSAHNLIRDSIDACALHFNVEKIKKQQDIQHVTSAYIIKNIDQAVSCWQKDRWAKHLSFDEFCEMLLPYKVQELQLLGNWRERLAKWPASSMEDIDLSDPYKYSTLEA